MKYIVGIILTCSVGLNLAFLTNMNRYQIEIRERKRHSDQVVMYYEYWSFTFPRVVNALDTSLMPTRYTNIIIGGDFYDDSTLPEKNFYVQFSHD
jgi:hypothetical protein